MARYRKFRHTWPQRFIFGINIVVAFGCLAGGGALVYANQQLANRKVVTISSNTKPDVVVDDIDVESLPTGDLSAKNFLITGSDQNACADADAPSADEVNNRPKYSGLTDSIMMIRIDPTNNQAAVLSFPRDLYVKIANSDHRNRINTAYRAKDPNRLIDTIRSNFAIEVDHYVSIDFCAFKSIVDAVGGVKVPFLFAARDRRTNFRVAKPGCAKLDGDKALSYVRSRHYFYFDTKKNKWIQDPSSDWGRIARQQDFIRRVLRAALDKGASNPSVANQLLSAALKNVITDDQLSPISLLQLARAMRNVTEDNVHTYTVEGYGKNVGGQSVIEPRLSSDSMEQILAIFQGKAAISEVANQEVTIESSIASGALPTTTLFAPITTTTTIASKTVGKASISRSIVAGKQPSAAATTTTTAAGSTTPTTAVQQEVTQQRFSIVPPNDPTCR
jgi:LCP family protein required for cell wall assembly